MFLKLVVWKKSSLYYSLLILLLLNVILFAYLYFNFLRNYDADKENYEKYVAELEVEKQNIVPLDSSAKGTLPNRSFTIDYENNVFLKDGKPFQYISGSLHYFRVPRVYWRDRLRKLRAAGLNVVCTYVEWSIHEPSPRNYKFTGDEDLEYFIQLAAEEDLLVILRPGPYICAERDFGGLPPWLMSLYPDIRLRTNDPNYQKETKIWFDVLLPKMKTLLYGNGGPIIMIQVENEYGSYFECSIEHKLWLRDLMKSHIENNAILFTTDGNADHFLRCGAIPEVYATIDFGTSTNVNTSFNAMRLYTPRGPLVNSEFYPGWLSHWDEKMQSVNTSLIVNTMKEMLEMKANFNFYMFFGGTNFGFMSGANFDSDLYQPQLTSYDYDAPLDEAGDPTPKYYKIRELISQYFKLPDIPEPKPAPKGNYGTMTLKPVLSLFDYASIPDAKTIKSQNTKTFEELNLKYGYVLYETIIPDNISDPAMLYVYELRDRAIVYVEDFPAAILSRSRHIYSTPLLAPPGRKLRLLVENQGRINFGSSLKDKKGILDPPLINNVPLYSWTMTTFPFEDVTWASSLQPSNQKILPPAIYVGELVLPDGESPLDTYVDMTGWGKGIIFVNNFNLGRYWPSTGSQVTLYVPGYYLRPAPQKNIITVFETEYTQREHKIVFKDKPILNKIPPISNIGG